jgi:hypothetical protein
VENTILAKLLQNTELALLTLRTEFILETHKMDIFPGNGWIEKQMVPSESVPQELSNERSCQYVSRILKFGDRNQHQTLTSSPQYDITYDITWTLNRWTYKKREIRSINKGIITLLVFRGLAPFCSFGNVFEGFLTRFYELYLHTLKAFGVILFHFEMDSMHQGGLLFKNFFVFSWVAGAAGRWRARPPCVGRTLIF